MFIDLPPSQGHVPVTEICIERSARSMGVSTDLIKAILQVEGGKIGMAQPNKGKSGRVFSYDLGPMQINTQWLSYFAKKGITASQLRNNGCVNVLAGSHILAMEISRAKTVSEGVAHYHSPTAKHQRRYLKKIIHALKKKLSIRNLLKRANNE